MIEYVIVLLFSISGVLNSPNVEYPATEIMVEAVYQIGKSGTKLCKPIKFPHADFSIERGSIANY